VKRQVIAAIFIVFFVLAAVGGLIYTNYRFATQNPGGYDFLARWAGARLFITEGLSPYDAEAVTRIQTLYYNRPARPDEDQVLFAYPFYTIFIVGPFALIEDFTLARALWMTVLEISVLLMAAACLRLTGWRLGVAMSAVYFLFTIFWYNSLRAVINGNIVALIALLVPAAALAIRAGQDEAAGLLLALMFIKPQLALLPVAFIIWWAFWQRRWRLIVWTVGALAFLVLAGMAFIPDWPLQNLREVLRYTSYSPATTLQEALIEWWPGIGRQLGWGVTLILSLVLLSEWWLGRQRDFRGFLWTLSLTLVASQWIGITTDPGNFLILFLPMILAFAVWEERWGRRWVIVAIMALLFFGLWALFLSTLKYTDQPMQSNVLFIPLPLFLLAALYWVRWWAIRPPRLLVETLKAREE